MKLVRAMYAQKYVNKREKLKFHNDLTHAHSSQNVFYTNFSTLLKPLFLLYCILYFNTAKEHKRREKTKKFSLYYRHKYF